MFSEFTREVRGDTSIWIERKLVASSLVDQFADSDRLLADPRCEIIKDQKKTTVGRLTLETGGVSYEIYIKRYNLFCVRHRLVSPFVT